jgi:hypothetical protein
VFDSVRHFFISAVDYRRISIFEDAVFGTAVFVLIGVPVQVIR